MLQPTAIKKFLKSAVDAAFFLGGNEHRGQVSWRFRRRLIFGAYRLAVAMIIFGAATFFFDTGVSNNLVTGGIALLTIIVTAYTATATWEDNTRLKNDKEMEP